MDVWYTPERMALHQEIDHRRTVRHERREREARRRQAVADALYMFEVAVSSLIALIGFYCWLLIATI